MPTRVIGQIVIHSEDLDQEGLAYFSSIELSEEQIKIKEAEIESLTLEKNDILRRLREMVSKQ